MAVASISCPKRVRTKVDSIVFSDNLACNTIPCVVHLYFVYLSRGHGIRSLRGGSTTQLAVYIEDVLRITSTRYVLTLFYCLLFVDRCQCSIPRFKGGMQSGRAYGSTTGTSSCSTGAFVKSPPTVSIALLIRDIFLTGSALQGTTSCGCTFFSSLFVTGLDLAHIKVGQFVRRNVFAAMARRETY